MDIYFPIDQIEIVVFREQDDTVIVQVILRREIRFDYKIAVFVNDQLYRTLNGTQGKTIGNYTLSSSIQGKIAAKFSVGEEDSAISDSVEIPSM